MNNYIVRLAAGNGTLGWYKHDNQEEFFYVVEGWLIISLDERTVELGP